MDDDRWVRIADALADPDRGEHLEDRGCSAATHLLGVEHAAVTITLGSASGRCTGSDDVARTLDEQQILMGDGPVVECRGSDWPILVEDVPAGRSERPGFADAAGALGVSAAFAFPLRIGAGHVGSLTGYRDRPGPLGDGKYADGLVLAAALTLLVVARISESEHGADDADDGLLDGQATVQRAVGMVSEQLGVSVVDALVILRSHAFAHGTSVRAVADRVLDRSLDFGRKEEP